MNVLVRQKVEAYQKARNPFLEMSKRKCTTCQERAMQRVADSLEQANISTLPDLQKRISNYVNHYRLNRPLTNSSPPTLK